MKMTLAATVQSTDDPGLWREIDTREVLSAGVAKDTVHYYARENEGDPAQQIATCESYMLALDEETDGPEIGIEWDLNADFRQRLAILWPPDHKGAGALDAEYSAAQLLQLAHLLDHKGVRAALERWAMEEFHINDEERRTKDG